MQDCLSYCKPIDTKRCIYVGDGQLLEIEAVNHFRLLLRIGYYLDLINTFVVLSFRWNLIFVFVLDKSSYSCSFEDNQFLLSINSNVIGTSLLIYYDNLYSLDTITSYQETLHASSCCTKWKFN